LREIAPCLPTQASREGLQPQLGLAYTPKEMQYETSVVLFAAVAVGMSQKCQQETL